MWSWYYMIWSNLCLMILRIWFEFCYEAYQNSPVSAINPLMPCIFKCFPFSLIPGENKTTSWGPKRLQNAPNVMHRRCWPIHPRCFRQHIAPTRQTSRRMGLRSCRSENQTKSKIIWSTHRKIIRQRRIGIHTWKCYHDEFININGLPRIKWIIAPCENEYD